MCNYLDALPFILMPLKHDNLKKYWNVIKVHLYLYDYTQHPMLYRFYKDTIKKVAIMNNDDIAPTFIKTIVDIFEHLGFDFSSITDFLPPSFYRLGFPNIVEHQITNLFIEFLQPLINNLYDKDPTLTRENKPIITVSLSGGVDSMITTYILAYLSKHYLFFGDRGFVLQAAHLNYLNRDVSNREAEFVCWFCNKIRVPIYVRTIHEIQRKENNRDFYETLTRDIRFDFYRKLPRTTEYPCVILGHNHDDIIENIWTNFAKGKFLFNLRKMEQIDLQDGVTLLRPLLFVTKTVIYDFSKKYDIAYLKNTTPEWSNRGKMRNEFLPAVEKQFANQTDVEFVADTLHEYGTFIEETLFRPILNNVVFEKEKNFVVIPIENSHLKLGIHFWQTLFGKLLNSMGIGEPSRKSIRNFVKSIQKNTDNSNWKCNIKKNIQITMKDLNKEKHLVLSFINNGHNNGHKSN
jgi:tRNA(Ile)-lysidine synthetase-like protein